MGLKPPSRCLFCRGNAFSLLFRYDAPPDGETHFSLPASAYRRDVIRCRDCGHLYSTHDMDDSELYSGRYVDAKYGREGLRAAFERIAGLDPSRSDNDARVARVDSFARARLAERRTPTVLDVGSGLCVFLHRMKAAGWEGTALDPDRRAADHAREIAGVRAVCGNFIAAEDLGCFDLVTFNKVLEHVTDPAEMLAQAARHIAPGGLVYVEMPDGEAATAEGPGREEFFIEHHHVFSAASFTLLVARAGFRLLRLERLREVSSKLTLFAFLEPVAGDGALSS